MDTKLNIPLEPGSPRQRYTIIAGHKKWLLTLFLILIVVGLYRIWITRDLTSNFHTNGIESTIRIIKNPGSAQQIHENLGSKAVISEYSITFNDVLLLCEREFSLHMDKNGVIQEISIDSKLSEQQKLHFSYLGLFVYESGHKTIISSIPTDVLQESSSIHPIRALNPWYDGDLIENNESRAISITKKGIRIYIGYTRNTTFTPEMATDSEVLANLQVSDDLQIPVISSFLRTNTINLNLITKIQESGFDVILANDAAGLAYYVKLKSDGMSAQDAAILANELLKSDNLSTLALTMDDGSTVQEIRANTAPASSSIESLPDLNLITIEGGNGYLIHMEQTPSDLAISNRKTSLISANYAPESSCNTNAHSFIKPEKLLEAANVVTPMDSSATPLALRFSELAISDRSTYLCW